MNENRDLLLDKLKHDFSIKNFDFDLTSGAQSTAQRLKVRLLVFLREWFLNQNFGQPYYEQVFRKAPDIALIEDAFKATILSTPRVIEILDFELDFNANVRKLFLNFSVSTLDGTIEIREVLNG